MARKLGDLNIKTIADLINHFPFRYRDFSLITLTALVQAGETVTLIGKITKIKNSYIRRSKVKTLQTATFEDKSGKINLVWFNQPYLPETLLPETSISVSGKIRLKGKQKQIISPEFEIFGKGIIDTTHTGRLVPIYPSTFGISNKYLRKSIKEVLPQVCGQIQDFLPAAILQEEKLIGKKEAILKIHFPKNKKEAEAAKTRLAFDELMLAEIKLLQGKQHWQKKQSAPKIIKDGKILERFVKNLPFMLTNAQKRTIDEILSDLGKPFAMNRLLQGDVGSGKTVVAAAAILQTANCDYQSVFMVPTEILAQQHYHNLKPLLEPFGIKTTLITSATSKRKIQPSSINHQSLFIGTHALIHKYANFQKVGLVIIDEQHRFGVSQRAKLIAKAKIPDKDKLSPHILTMTATPIPRTISLTVYGDLDISVLDEMPKGRKPVKTFLIPNRKREKCYHWIEDQIRLPTPDLRPQVFIVCPFIEESETFASVKAATVEFEKLKKDIFPKLNLALLHGKMKTKEKEETLLKMRGGKIDILVTTPVVEVGIDIPAASIMIIEAAQRFGLASLHQLRGRVGRAGQTAYCFLFAEKLGQKSRKRIAAMEKLNDGMKLAEIDLEIRGPGEVYGIAQHGFPEFKIASFSDVNLISRARAWAEKILAQTPDLSLFPELKKQITTQNLLVAPN